VELHFDPKACADCDAIAARWLECPVSGALFGLVGKGLSTFQRAHNDDMTGSVDLDFEDHVCVALCASWVWRSECCRGTRRLNHYFVGERGQRLGDSSHEEQYRRQGAGEFRRWGPLRASRLYVLLLLAGWPPLRRT